MFSSQLSHSWWRGRLPALAFPEAPALVLCFWQHGGDVERDHSRWGRRSVLSFLRQRVWMHLWAAVYPLQRPANLFRHQTKQTAPAKLLAKVPDANTSESQECLTLLLWVETPTTPTSILTLILNLWAPHPKPKPLTDKWANINKSQQIVDSFRNTRRTWLTGCCPGWFKMLRRKLEIHVYLPQRMFKKRMKEKSRKKISPLFAFFL